MKLVTDGYEFDFAHAVALYKFDEPDKSNAHYHGLSYCMKAVDVIAEFPNFQLWIEIKDYPQLRLEQIRKGEKGKSGKTIVREIQETLKLKFRDTFLYRYGEGCNKKIVYVCLTNFNNKECEYFCKQLKKVIPAGTKGPRWSIELVASEHCFVVDIHAWKRNFESKFGTCKKIQ